MNAPAPRIGLSVTAAFLHGDLSLVRAVVHAADAAGLDYLQVGDHVSFHDGTGFDGVVHAAAALTLQERMPVQIGLYLLALRHPVIAARQVADVARMAPGRVVLGVGVGGEDRHEFDIVGVDPATRGRRTDESLEVLDALLAGRPVTQHGDFFDLDEALVTPRPDPPVRVLVGGRSDAALRRTGRFGTGWLGLWTSPRRYREVVSTVGDVARDAGRSAVEWDHGLNLWCGLDLGGRRGRDTLAAAVEDRYKMPFERFERWCPSGTADDVAAAIEPYADAGCSHVTIVLHDADLVAAARGAGAIRDRVHARATA